MAAWIDGAPASQKAALDKAAALLAAARAPALIGCASDALDARAALSLMRALRGTADCLDGAATLGALGVMAQAGALFCQPAVAKAEATLVVAVGRAADHDWMTELFAGKPVLRLAPDLAAIAGARAALKGRPGGAPEGHDLANPMKNALYSVVFYDIFECGPLLQDALLGLVREANATTRAALLAAPQGVAAMAAALACVSLTGFQLRVSFAGARPAHDPWRYNAARMLAAGEIDAALWLGPLARINPPEAPNLIVLDAHPAPRPGAAVQIRVSAAGDDREGVVYDPRAGALATVRPSLTTGRPAAFEILAALEARILALEGAA